MYTRVITKIYTDKLKSLFVCLVERANITKYWSGLCPKVILMLASPVIEEDHMLIIFYHATITKSGISLINVTKSLEHF